MPTIAEVAQAVGVSPSTVSRVLNRKTSHLVSEATRRRVLATAERLGYQPSAAARALTTGRTNVVAIAFWPTNHPHYARMIAEAEAVVDEHGYHLLLVTGARSQEEQLSALLRERRVDVLMDVTYPVDRVGHLAQACVLPNQRVLALGPVDETPPPEVSSAYWDDRKGVRKAVSHLFGLGHGRLAFLGGQVGQYKRRAFEAAAAQLDLDGTVIDCEDEGDQLAAGAGMALRAIEQRPRPTALLCRNDQFALGALHSLHEAGLEVPDDISVVGYNDTPMSSYSQPTLTTVRTPIVECANALLSSALTGLSEAADAQGDAVRAFSFDTRLQVRRSTGPPPLG
jgi:LacI family transcriptional regulator